LHPQPPLPSVREADDSGSGEVVEVAVATYGICWHYEAGVQLLRLIVGSVFDRFPDHHALAASDAHLRQDRPTQQYCAHRSDDTEADCR
jgi:hypothetical protein